MKALFGSFGGKKTVVAFVFSLSLVGVSLLFSHASEKVFGATGSTGGISPVGGVTIGGVVGDLSGGGSATELCGFAWGATNELPTPKMGAGWVSFNSKDCDTDGSGSISSAEAAARPGCPVGFTGTYGVNISARNDLTGYAWSGNLGWIKFGSLTGMPSTSGNSSSNARIQSNGSLQGWARACSGTVNNDCSSMTARSDGWDGWISLVGNGVAVGSSYGVKASNAGGVKNLSGYSWGGPVIGWLKWDQASGNGVRTCNAQNLITTLTANPTHGRATLTPTLAVSYQLSFEAQRQLAQPAPTPSYRFKCDYSGTWSAPQSSNTYTGCSYSQENTYFHPQAEVTYGTLSSIGSAEVFVDPAPVPPPTTDLGASCSVTPNPVYINQPATWKVTISPSGTPPYVYTYIFDGDTTHPVVVNSSASQTTVDKTYSILGPKHVDVTVLDSVSGGASGSCDADTRVIVRPNIIEI